MAEKKRYKMKKHLKFSNFLLLFLTLAVLGLFGEIVNLTPDSTAYMPNTDSGFSYIKTDFGTFPVLIDDIKAADDSTQLTLILINPTNIHFADAGISIAVNGTVETERMNLLPSSNEVKFKIPPIDRGHPIEVSLELDRIYFK